MDPDSTFKRLRQMVIDGLTLLGVVALLTVELTL